MRKETHNMDWRKTKRKQACDYLMKIITDVENASKIDGKF